MDISYIDLENEVKELINRSKNFVIATSADDRVTARTMGCINIGLKIYFQTDKNFTKCKQIEKNENVAICVSNIQIEGKAVIGKHPLDDCNKEFIELFKKKYPSSFDKYSRLKNNRVIEINPTFITLWKYIDGKPCRDFLHISHKKAEREYYNINE